ncbi:hypothetical protein [uncultured Bradyrhizobium sp.]|uniref:hypothetical protein n=1 Tax=uncultured Bradyrhizobium sp. TaxID=199684 RepID=UPI00261F42F7|nr:hypothetical protein [uncultured Bradyrhizobium sp.]
MLSRIPAVKWAFNRLRPMPRSGSIDAAQIAVDEQPAVVAIAEMAPTAETIADEISSPETLTEVAPAVVEEIAVPSVEVASEPVDALALISSDAPAPPSTLVEPDNVEEAPVTSVETEAIDAAEVISGLPAELPANAEPAVAEGTPVCSAEVEAIEPPEPVISSDPSSEDDAEVAPAVAEQAPVSPIEVESVPVKASEPVIEDGPASVASVEIEAVALDETPAVVADTDFAAPAVAEVRIESAPAPSVVTEIEPVVASDPAPVVAEIAEDAIVDAAVVAAQVEAPAAAAPKKSRPKVVEPADRAALIRQRWAETGIRMWNPRLHGTGDATLNIQGRIGLLPPEPGETMPRYDKLEFKMLGGQIVCEGVIVEAPAHAGQRSFTRLAEPRGADRSREPARERQAALA